MRQTKTSPLHFLIGGILSLLGHELASANTWEVLQKRDGIEVTRRELSEDGLYQFRGLGYIQGSWQEILAVVVDIKLQRKWVHGCVEATLIEENISKAPSLAFKEYFGISYGVQDLPWPLADRDYVIKSGLKVLKHPQTSLVSKVRFEARNVTDARVKEKADRVRMPHLEMILEMTPVGGRTLVDFRVTADPGGHIPKWVADLVSKDIPHYTIVQLRQLVARKAYQAKALAQIQEIPLP